MRKTPELKAFLLRKSLEALQMKQVTNQRLQLLLSRATRLVSQGIHANRQLQEVTN